MKLMQWGANWEMDLSGYEWFTMYLKIVLEKKIYLFDISCCTLKSCNVLENESWTWKFLEYEFFSLKLNFFRHLNFSRSFWTVLKMKTWNSWTKFIKLIQKPFWNIKNTKQHLTTFSSFPSSKDMRGRMNFCSCSSFLFRLNLLS